MTGAPNTLTLHIPDLSPPKYLRPRASRYPQLTSMQPEQLPPPPPPPPHAVLPANKTAANATKNVNKNATKNASRAQEAPNEKHSIDASTRLFSPSHIAMFLAGLAVAQLHPLLIIFSLLCVLVVALVRSSGSSDSAAAPGPHKVAKKPAPKRQAHPDPPQHRKYPRNVARRTVGSSIDESFAFRPYG